jgi:hypothetical protein
MKHRHGIDADHKHFGIHDSSGMEQLDFNSYLKSGITTVTAGNDRDWGEFDINKDDAIGIVKHLLEVYKIQASVILFGDKSEKEV